MNCPKSRTVVRARCAGDVHVGKTRGEGRSKGEKGQTFRSSIPTLREVEEQRRREEEEWAARSGPVTVRKIVKEN